MTDFEIIICIILLLMSVPDLCHRLGRPSLVFSVYIVFGILVGPLVSQGAFTMLKQAGVFGFLLLLFEVGLEIELPPFRRFVRPLRYALAWSLLQYPLVLALTGFTAMTPLQMLIAAAALTACSVGMAFPAWKAFSGIPEGSRDFVLMVMVALEMIAIVVLAVEATAVGKGLHWIILLKLVGMAVVVFLVARFSVHLTTLFQKIIEKTTHWRVHLLILLILAVCAIGERLGLGGSKTALVLGLALSRARHNGLDLEQYMAPISHRFLIPIFFVALGMQVSWSTLLSPLGVIAASTGIILIGAREILQRRWLRIEGDKRMFLLFCPNLTIVALAASVLLEHQVQSEVAGWLVIAGLFTTVPAILLLPSGKAATTMPEAVSKPPPFGH